MENLNAHISRDTWMEAIDQVAKVIYSHEELFATDPEERDWRVDPTHVLEITIEILESLDVQVPQGMFNQKLNDRVSELTQRDEDFDIEEEDYPGLADDIINILLDPDMYTRG